MKKTMKILSILLAAALLCLVFVACGEDKPLEYSGGALATANVGTAYTANIGTATGEGEPTITYAFKEGSNLPAGLTLAPDGKISGTPTVVANNHKFTVEATANGFITAEAEFSITVMAAGVNLYTFEAALTDLDNVSGGGLSGNPAGKNMIVKGASAADTISNINGTHAFVGSLHKMGVTITYNFNSTAAATGKLKLSIGEDLAGAIHSWGPSQFEIKVNDIVVTYTPFELYRESASTLIDFELHEIGTINLLSGANTITLSVKANEYYNGATGGPALDCIQIETTAELSWVPKTTNLA